MEDTLGAGQRMSLTHSLQSLNPCSNGRYSRSEHFKVNNKRNRVLILVLMEDTLGEELRQGSHRSLRS